MKLPISSSDEWGSEASAELYDLNLWGNGYFAINDRGNVVVRPDKSLGREIEVHEVVRRLAENGLETPLLLRFSSMLTHRLQAIHRAFDQAMVENDYGGDYLAVYPIKVNQQRAVVDEVYRYGQRYRFGLEVGSKPELLAVMAFASDADPRMVVCNGFKDDDYIETVILATKLGQTVVPVVEKLDELDRILRYSIAYGVKPRIGVRVKLASEGVGRWRESSGAKSKFGLFATEVLELLSELRNRGMEDCLELVHCHAGSQLHDIRRVKSAVGELAHFYVELSRLGAAGLRYIDVGGGLGVDYDGSRSNYASSMNYGLEEYASEVVYRIATICSDASVEHPVIVTESGRAITAYQSLLVLNVVGRSAVSEFDVARDLPEPGVGQCSQPVLDLIEASQDLSERRILECYHDAVAAFGQMHDLFSLGYLGLEERAFAERLFWRTCVRVRDLARRMKDPPEELADLETKLADVYFCNFSLFQSLPDHWAIGQLFPIMPIHRLQEAPTREAVLADMTCDSDGKVDRFVDLRDVKKTLRLHDLECAHESQEPYYLGVFLVGAYQEVLGCLHNLFGDTHVVHVELEESGAWRAGEVVEGDSAAEVLSYLQYDVQQLREALRVSTSRAVDRGLLNSEDSSRLLAHFDEELEAYTYLNVDR